MSGQFRPLALLTGCNAGEREERSATAWSNVIAGVLLILLTLPCGMVREQYGN